MRHVDVVIAGAGPAGLACALRAADHGLSVALFDPQGRVFDKPCGEGILPTGVRALRTLGLDDVETLARPFARLTYLLPRAQPLELSLSQPGWAVWRTDLLAAFDRALSRRAGVTRVAERVMHVERDGRTGHVRIVSASGAWSASCLVVACGSHGRADGLAAARRARRPRLGVRVRCAAAEPLERVVVGLGERFELYLTPLPRGAVNVALLVDRAPAQVRGADALFDWALAREPDVTRWIGRRLERATARDVRTAQPRAAHAPRILFAGDAAGAVDPVIGCGVALALTSGIDAADGAHALARGGDALAIGRRTARRWTRDVRMKRAIAAAIRAAARHPRLARVALGALRAYPKLADAVVRRVENVQFAAPARPHDEKRSAMEPGATRRRQHDQPPRSDRTENRATALARDPCRSENCDG